MLELVRKLLDYNEVLKLYKLYAYSQLGKEDLENLNPSNVNASQELTYIGELVEHIRQNGIPPTEAFVDIRETIEKLKKGLFLEFDEFRALSQFFRGVSALKETFRLQKSTIFGVQSINAFVSKLFDYDELNTEIMRVFDEEGRVRDNASVLLKKIRQEVRETTNEIRQKVERLISKSGNILQENTYTIKNERYVLPIKANEKGKIKGIVHGTSASGATVYLEPEELIPLNDKIAVLGEEEGREIARILTELESKIRGRLKDIEKDVKIVGKIDSLLARARFVIEKNAGIVFPGGNYVKILSARHPLIPENKVVPVSIELPTDKLGIIITGPNTGGKTVTLKTVGLCILLARSGFPILASESSRIPDFEVFIDVGDSQNILENLSTFSGHIRNIVKALEVANENYIVLIDELGSGTDPYEGSALALGIIEELIERKIKFIVTTHLTPVKLYSMSHDKLITASMEFDPETLSPTYKLLMNVPGGSHAFEIAQKYGLDEKIIEKAKQHLNEDKIKIEELIKNLNIKVSELEQKKAELEQVLRDYQKQKNEFEERYKLLKVKRIEDMDKELRELYRDFQKAKRDLQIAIHSTKTGNEALIKKRLKEIEEDSKQLLEIEEKLESVLVKTKFEEKEIPEVGEYVKLRNGTVVGKVIEQKGNKLLVDFNGMRIEVKPEKLVVVPAPKETETQTKQQVQRSTTEKVRIEIPLEENKVDVRGLSIEEAIEKIEEFIDRLILSEYSVGYIIHGKGTGRLATGIWTYLKKNKAVKNYRFGRPDEGGVGVTVVEV